MHVFTATTSTDSADIAIEGSGVVF
jgi:hypothetical protein